MTNLGRSTEIFSPMGDFLLTKNNNNIRDVLISKGFACKYAIQSTLGVEFKQLSNRYWWAAGIS